MTTSKREEIERLSAKLQAAINAPVAVKPTCTISKSKFVSGMQCLKRLYLQVRHPDLGVISDDAKAVMVQGTQLGILAQNFFEGGISVTSDYEHLTEAIRTSRELVENREVPAIFEGTFAHDGVLVRVDVLKRSDGGFRLIEVKSSTKVKPQYAHDVGIQLHVLSGADIKVCCAELMHLNRKYVFDGQMEAGANKYDLARLFTIDDIQPTSRGEVSRCLNNEFKILSQPNPPQIKPGRNCNDPIDCEFYDYCHPTLPDQHIGNLPIRPEKIDSLLSMGITSIDQIPPSFILFNLSPGERLKVNAIRTQTLWVRPELVAELGSLRYPLCYMDFETIFPALPRYAGMRPYDQVPFQWSVHRQDEPNVPVQHFEFLAETSADSREAFVKSLWNAVGGVKTVVVYNKTFEATRLRELALAFPAYATQVANIQAKIWDLLPVIRRNVYHPAFGASYSLKRVLPAFIPKMSYDGMEVANGTQAGRAWMRMIDDATPAKEKLRIKNSLLKYCGQDTLALACLVDALRRCARTRSNGES
jgi:hypothetical protein